MKNRLNSQENNEWDAVYAGRGIVKGYKVAVKGHDKQFTENTNIKKIQQTNQIYIYNSVL